MPCEFFLFLIKIATKKSWEFFSFFSFYFSLLSRLRTLFSMKMMYWREVMMMVISRYNERHSSLDEHWLRDVAWNADVLLLYDWNMSNLLDKHRDFLLDDHLLDLTRRVKVMVVAGIVTLMLLRSFTLLHYRFRWDSDGEHRHEQSKLSLARYSDRKMIYFLKVINFFIRQSLPVCSFFNPNFIVHFYFNDLMICEL